VDGDTDLARDVVRATTLELPAGKPITSPVRSYEEHVARALLSEGFREIATAMLFVKELAVRIEEPAWAPAVVR
jgi:lysozyme family protein